MYLNVLRRPCALIAQEHFKVKTNLKWFTETGLYFRWIQCDEFAVKSSKKGIRMVWRPSYGGQSLSRRLGTLTFNRHHLERDLKHCCLILVHLNSSALRWSETRTIFRNRNSLQKQGQSLPSERTDNRERVLAQKTTTRCHAQRSKSTGRWVWSTKFVINVAV